MVLLSSVFLFTECVPCGRTVGVAVETCEINPDEDQYYVINCEIHATSINCLFTRLLEHSFISM